MKKRDMKHIAISVTSVFVVIFIWHMYTAVLELVPNNTLPTPGKVFNSFFAKIINTNPDGGTLIDHTIASLKIALSGYLVAIIIGVPLGILMAWYKYVDRFVTPIFDLLKPVPGVAWIPLMIVIFGIGMESKVAVVFLSAVVPCVLNSYAGIKQTKEVHKWVARTFGAKNYEILYRIAIPTALPYIMTGIRVALGSAWIAIVAAELLGATEGLGFMIQQARGIFRTDLVIVGMLAIGLCGTVLTKLLGIVEKRVVKGRKEHEG